MLAVTGTDGKTTTTLLAVDMLAAGRRARGRRRQHRRPAGRGARPRRRRLRRRVHELPAGLDRAFRGDAAAWLNLAPDHLNWHAVDGHLRGGQGAHLHPAAARRRRHRLRRRPGRDGPPRRGARPATSRSRTTGADYHVAGSGADAVLVGPQGRSAPVASLRPGAAPRPHERPRRRRARARDRARRARRASPPRSASFVGPPHRIELVGDADGVRWFNDSKATTPHAASVAIRAFDHVVLIAGGLQQGPRPDADGRRARPASAPSWRSARPPT